MQSTPVASASTLALAVQQTCTPLFAEQHLLGGKENRLSGSGSHECTGMVAIIIYNKRHFYLSGAIRVHDEHDEWGEDFLPFIKTFPGEHCSEFVNRGTSPKAKGKELLYSSRT
eukprot:scpid74331/ scgid21337/ 